MDYEVGEVFEKDGKRYIVLNYAIEWGATHMNAFTNERIYEVIEEGGDEIETMKIK